MIDYTKFMILISIMFSFSFLHARKKSNFKKDSFQVKMHWNQIENFFEHGHTINKEILENKAENHSNSNHFPLQESASKVSKKQPNFSSCYLPSHYRWKRNFHDNYLHDQYDGDSRQIDEDIRKPLRKKHDHLAKKLINFFFSSQKKRKRKRKLKKPLLYNKSMLGSIQKRIQAVQNKKKINDNDGTHSFPTTKIFQSNKSSQENRMWNHVFPVQSLKFNQKKEKKDLFQ